MRSPRTKSSAVRPRARSWWSTSERRRPSTPSPRKASILEARFVPASRFPRTRYSSARQTDGHLVRVVGPSFDLVSRWAAQGIPLKIAFRGVDRRFERYYAKGPRRRPLRIEFCEADVLDAFDEWRRAVGLTQSTVDS